MIQRLTQFVLFIGVFWLTGCAPISPPEILAPNPGKIEDHHVLKMTGTMRTNTESWYYSHDASIQRIEIDITEYPWAKKVLFGAMLRTSDVENAAIAELYNLTDDKPIVETELRSNCNCFLYVETQDILRHLPRKKVTLAMRIRSEREGILVTNNYNSYLMVFNR